MKLFNIENFAVSKYPKNGKCKKSCFKIGYHRIGVIPMMSIIDGGSPGCSCKEVCLECGSVFKQGMFFPIKQPSLAGQGAKE